MEPPKNAIPGTQASGREPGSGASKNISPLTEARVRASLRVKADLSVFETVTSTNDLMKQAGPPDPDAPRVIIADRQTAGRGRLGRQFSSPSGTGIYMTIGLRPVFDLGRAPMATLAAAVAVCRAVERVAGNSPRIKWVNDLFLNSRKICGILTEAQTDASGRFGQLVCGIGVNCFPESFPPELRNIAGPVSDCPGSFDRSVLAAEITNEAVLLLHALPDTSFLDEYRRRCFILGRSVTVHSAPDDPGVPAKALTITDDGGLTVEYLPGSPAAGQTETLHAGEVSIRSFGGPGPD